jgi:menaquinone-dependent protoporphyrinogen oxidase
MAKKMAGDWRNPAHVRQWVTTVVNELDPPTITHQT